MVITFRIIAGSSEMKCGKKHFQELHLQLSKTVADWDWARFNVPPNTL